IQLVFDLLRSRTGTPVSYQSISEDAGVSPNTVKKYIQILESLFIVFRVMPYSKNVARSILKMPKLYFYDTGLVNGDEGARFENMVALCLLKHVYGRVDLLGRNDFLNYIRTKDGAEIDFCLVEDNRPVMLIEAKRSEVRPERALVNFCRRYDIPAIQLVLHLKQERMDRGVKIRRGMSFLESLQIKKDSPSFL
ncbi:MAG TPA: DUF4143 domain-containing protein, partial [Alphaproteobacteria bacterium]|nr:DUF4143 domain-containing protein [Alphaproteobacteria bacterium]